jgi:hypothetical protein
MTRGSGIMRIFRQNRHFSKVLVVWEATVQALVVREAIQRITGNLRG